MSNKLPIDVIPNTNPPRFRWMKIFDKHTHPRKVQCEGVLDPSVEEAVLALIEYAKDLEKGCEAALKRISALEEELTQRPTPRPAPGMPIPQGGTGKRGK